MRHCAYPAEATGQPIESQAIEGASRQRAAPCSQFVDAAARKRWHSVPRSKLSCPQHDGTRGHLLASRPVRSASTRTSSSVARQPRAWGHSRGLSLPVHSRWRTSANSSQRALLATLLHHAMKLRSLAHPLSRQLSGAVTRGLLAAKRSNPSVKPTHSGLRPPRAAYLKR